MNYDEKFERAVKRVLEFEGGYVIDPNDSGGETKFGICKRSYPKLDIKNLTIEGAKAIYYEDFWESQKYKEFNSTKVAEKVFDMAVNMGSRQANELLQRALRAVGNPVKEDGIVGKITLIAVNASEESALLAALRSESAGFYRILAATKPRNRRFLSGWLRRAYA